LPSPFRSAVAADIGANPTLEDGAPGSPISPVQAAFTHAPRPSHSVPPIEHGLPAAAGLLTGAPLSQTSSVHAL
jgi:hypothetical protein